MSDTDFHDPDLARWLQEAGRRRSVRGAGLEASAPLEAIAEPVRAEAPAITAPERRRFITHPRELILLVLAAVAFQSYFFADVYLQIYSLSSVIFFV